MASAECAGLSRSSRIPIASTMQKTPMFWHDCGSKLGSGLYICRKMVSWRSSSEIGVYLNESSEVKQKGGKRRNVHPGSMSEIYFTYDFSGGLAGQLTQNSVANIFYGPSGRCGEWKAMTKPREVRWHCHRRGIGCRRRTLLIWTFLVLDTTRVSFLWVQRYKILKYSLEEDTI